jgi:CRP-like cAMP-binding protein
LLRADTSLSQQVSTGIKERQMLKRMALFSSLSPQELAALDARLQAKQVKAGTVIIRQGEPRTHLFIIEQGSLNIYITENGSETLMGTLGPGEHFGEYALFTDSPYQATLKAAIDSKLLLLDEPKFDELVASYDRMTHYVEQIGSGRLMVSQRRSALLS